MISTVATIIDTRITELNHSGIIPILIPSHPQAALDYFPYNHPPRTTFYLRPTGRITDPSLLLMLDAHGASISWPPSSQMYLPLTHSQRNAMGQLLRYLIGRTVRPLRWWLTAIGPIGPSASKALMGTSYGSDGKSSCVRCGKDGGALGEESGLNGEHWDVPMDWIDHGKLDGPVCSIPCVRTEPVASKELLPRGLFGDDARRVGQEVNVLEDWEEI